MADSKDTSQSSAAKGPSYRDTISSCQAYYSNPYQENCDFKKAQRIMHREKFLLKKNRHFHFDQSFNPQGKLPGGIRFFKILVLTFILPFYYPFYMLPKSLYRKTSPRLSRAAQMAKNQSKRLQTKAAKTKYRVQVAPLKFFAYLRAYANAVKMSVKQSLHNLEHD